MRAERGADRRCRRGLPGGDLEDRTFSFITKTPPTPVLLRQAAGLDKGATTTGTQIVGSITQAQLEEIAQTKMPDLNAYDLDAAKRQVAGTARSMGIEVR